MNTTQTTRKRALVKRPFFWPALALVVLALIFTGLELTGVTHVFHKKSKVDQIIGSPDTGGGGSENNQKGEPQNSNNSSSNSSTMNGTEPGDSKSDTGGGTTAALVTPSGDFVSAHHVNMTSPLASVCNTTPGASCQITFTSGATTKSLTAETTDRGGSAYWNSWTPQSVGLTAGRWQIQAIASLNGQTKSASDAMNLVVSP